MSTPNLHETFILLTAMRNAGYRVRLSPAGDLSVGPAAMVTDNDRETIADHRPNILKVLQGERAAAEMLDALRIECADFDARPAMYRGKRLVTETGAALGITQADIDGLDRKKGELA